MCQSTGGEDVSQQYPSNSLFLPTVHSDATTHALEAISSVSDIALGTSAKIDDITNRTSALLIGTRDTYTKVHTIKTAVLALQAQISGIERVLLKNSVIKSDISDRIAREQQNMPMKGTRW
jgi:hypothetical protein